MVAAATAAEELFTKSSNHKVQHGSSSSRVEELFTKSSNHKTTCIQFITTSISQNY